MINIDKSIHINKNCEKVFDFAADYRNDIKWRSNVRDMQLLPSGQIKRGVKTRELLNFMGKNYLTIAEVVDYKYCSITSFKGENNTSFVTGFREFLPNDNGTIFRYSLQLSPKGFMKILAPILGRALNKQIKKDLNKLKQILEN